MQISTDWHTGNLLDSRMIEQRDMLEVSLIMFLWISLQ